MIDPATLPARICDILQRHPPHAPALVDNGRTWTYGELRDEAERRAAWLRGLGVRAGDRVMLVSENCAAQVALLFAVARLDAWSVNVNARLSEGELAAIRAHCTPRRVIHATPAGLTAGPLDAHAVPESDGAGIAALVYTTGTTGNPKGVMLSHASLLFVAATSSRLRGLVPNDRAAGVLPISHVYGLTSVLLGTLYAGACLHLAPRFDAAVLLAQIRAGELTIVQGVPAMYARLLALAGTEPVASRLRFCYAGGSPLDPGLKRAVEAMFGLPLHNGYGLTESAPTVCQTRLDAPRADTSVGHSIPGVEVRIEGNGELWVRGPNVMAGYYRDPVQTAAVLRPGGWLATGDIAEMGEDGALFIRGRLKELIIRSGFNVYPPEVEAALNSHPAVLQSAVVGRPVADGNEEVVAFVEAREAVDAAGLQAWLVTRLAPYKRPARIVFMETLPASPSGKVLKHKL
ncbi:AMP-binding protein [Massilia sp. G4R7]|uniref:AMP-binding protein n=1 Tax=Massilia phyllostachyos TaxID=2898585 RepID=A0ABS8Q0Q2_9BURK|nr:AMP-binding protein [Massilia phyllostachyos]MCD2515318.1 AMP-binding protein [Massilia phyllostachyos]